MKTITVPCPYCYAQPGNFCCVVRPRTREIGFRYNPNWGYIHEQRKA